MQLLYIWIESYHNIKNQGFNFSSEYFIDFNHVNKVLNVSPNTNFIPKFFGDTISNITAIVGENGTGKSSILSLNSTKFYLIKKNKNNLILVHESDYSVIVSADSRFTIEYQKENRLNDTLILKYSNHCDIDIVNNYQKSQFALNEIISLSTNNVIKFALKSSSNNSPDYSNSKSDPISRNLQMNLSEIFSQMNFVLNDYNAEKLPYNFQNLLCKDEHIYLNSILYLA